MERNIDPIIKVLVVDDSALIRQTLTNILQSDPNIEVIASASDPYDAVKKIKTQKPDVITLDIEMPGMDGLTFLQKIMNQHPIPVVMISSLTTQGSSSAIKALQYGAVEIIAKPKVNTKESLQHSQKYLCHAVKAASKAKVNTLRLHRLAKVQKPSTVITSDIATQLPCLHTDPLVLIGASTGGTQIITKILQNIQAPNSALIITQHMPEHFTALFAQRLNQLSELKVKEAQHGEIVRKSCAYVAPGNKHLRIRKSANHYILDLGNDEVVNRHRPSIDVLFESASAILSSNSTAILLTGMGEDGARGLLTLKENGLQTIAQDESSSAVYGMPKRAAELGAALYIYKPNEMIDFINNLRNNPQ